MTEGQLTHQLLVLGAGIFGTTIYDIRPFELLLSPGTLPPYIMELPLNAILASAAIGSFLNYAVNNISMALRKTTQGKCYALGQLASLSFIHGSLFFWSYAPVYSYYTAYVIYAAGLLFSLVTSKLIVAGMTHVLSC